MIVVCVGVEFRIVPHFGEGRILSGIRVAHIEIVVEEWLEPLESFGGNQHVDLVRPRVDHLHRSVPLSSDFLLEFIGESWSHPVILPLADDGGDTDDPDSIRSGGQWVRPLEPDNVFFPDWVTKNPDRKAVAGKLLARSLYNGQILWERELPPNIEPDQPICALDADRIYLAVGDACRVLTINGLAPAADGPWVLTLRDGSLAVVTGNEQPVE